MDVYQDIFGVSYLDLEEIEHSGLGHDDDPPGRGSGRYGWGTGLRPNQHDFSLNARYEKYKAANPGLSDAEIAKHFGFIKTDYRKNPFSVLSACDFWNDTLVNFMKRNLCRYNIGDNLFAVLNDGAGCFITTAFYTKNFHLTLLFHL